MVTGYLVLGIDYFEGDSIAFHVDKEGWDRQGWIKRQQVRAAELIPPWVDAVREQYGVFKKLGSKRWRKLIPIRSGQEVYLCWCVIVTTVGRETRTHLAWYEGYCFGAPYVMQLLASDWVTAGESAAYRRYGRQDTHHNEHRWICTPCILG